MSSSPSACDASLLALIGVKNVSHCNTAAAVVAAHTTIAIVIVNIIFIISLFISIPKRCVVSQFAW